jgi:hypothetical protein
LVVKKKEWLFVSDTHSPAGASQQMKRSPFIKFLFLYCHPCAPRRSFLFQLFRLSGKVPSLGMVNPEQNGSELSEIFKGHRRGKIPARLSAIEVWLIF